MSDKKSISSLQGITNSLQSCGITPALGLEKWNPPYCGDIGLAIQANGTWTYQGSPISRPGLLKLFSSVLYRDVDGRTYLITPYEKVDVAVTDAAFIATGIDVIGEGQGQTLLFRTNLDDCASAGPENPLRFEINPLTGAIKPYLLIRYRLEALLTRDVTRQLLNLIVDVSSPGIWSGGLFFKIPCLPINNKE